MYNVESRTLVGPFTAVTENANQIEPGTWSTEINPDSLSGNIKVEWEDLHIIENALDRYTFLRDPKTCELPTLTVQTLLEDLKNAPFYRGEPQLPAHS